MADGLLSTGFERRRLETIKTNLETEFKSVFGNNLDVSPESPDGQIIGIVAASIAELWEIAEGDYNAFNPSAATQTALSNLVQLNGIERREATNSTVTLTLTGVNGTSVPAGSQVSTDDGSVSFVTDSTVVIPVSATIDVTATATVTGASIATSGTITVIDTPITGWTSVTNSADAIPGTDDESDPELRARRERSVTKAAKGILDTILAEVLELNGVEEAFIYENDTLVTDAVTGTPGKAFQVVALGGLDAEIAKAIFDEKPVGIEAYGTTTVAVADSQGTSHDIGFTRPTSIDIYIIVDLDTFAGFPTDGASTIKQNIVDYAEGNLITGRGFGVGDDVIQTELYTPVNQVPLHDITAIKIDIAPTPTLSDNITIDFNEVSNFTIANIIVNENPV